MTKSIIIILITIILILMAICIVNINNNKYDKAINSNLELEFNNKLHEKDNEIDILTVENINLNNNIINLNNDIINLENHIEALESDINNKESTINELYVLANKEYIRENHIIIEDEFTDNDGDTIKYILYCPNGFDSDTEKSLILYLHGSGEVGDNLNILHTCNGLSRDVYNGNIVTDAYILIPQNPYGSWIQHDKVIFNLIDYLRDSYKIGNIAITGHSLGGYGTIDFILKYPDYFIAAAPLSAYADENTVKNIKIPIKFLCGELDGPSASNIAASEVINSNGGNSEAIIFENEAHMITHHYRDDNEKLLNWLINPNISQ